ncbi:DUF6520 family protein [Flavobacterium taihuense]|mgnify:CR=1 FL=1|jgi:hypothetical protein|uniref:Uncharacterized protein n=1 Tax=Flavobacterium taihuense TaxID=2857508 RepID=A0ABS6XV41_9FLAO|nr:DUF6520 family protein [Flavobacterium taihuense]MBW4360551.1 hypothetical protein [Flavobacterium taihuense]
MKTTILRAFVLPVAAFALASAGAVSTNTSDVSKTDVLIPAYIHNLPVDKCQEVQVNCASGGGPACLYGSFTAYGGNETSCNEQLHRVN